MNLGKKKKLAIRTFGVGKSKISFLKPRLEEIKEAITKQDMRGLKEEGAIIIHETRGKKVKKKKKGGGPGNIRKKVNRRKKDYVIMTRKQRKYASEMRKQEKISRQEEIEIRKKIRNKAFRSLAHLREHVGGFEK